MSLISQLTLDDVAHLADVAPGLLWQMPGLPPATELPDGGLGWQGFIVGKVRAWCASVAARPGICGRHSGRHSEWWQSFDPLGRSGEYSTSDAVLAGVLPLDIMRAATPGGALPPLQEQGDGGLGWQGDDAMRARVWARQWLSGHDHDHLDQDHDHLDHDHDQDHLKGNHHG